VRGQAAGRASERRVAEKLANHIAAGREYPEMADCCRSVFAGEWLRAPIPDFRWPCGQATGVPRERVFETERLRQAVGHHPGEPNIGQVFIIT
jgi:hypothetical protein